MVDTGAIYRVVCAIVDVIVAIQQTYPRHPVVGLFGPVAVRAVACVSGETGGELEKAAVRDGGFVVESGVVGVELPLQPAVAGGGVPARASHVVEDALGELDVGDVGGGGEGEGTLGGGHGGEAPEDLVIVAL